MNTRTCAGQLDSSSFNSGSPTIRRPVLTDRRRLAICVGRLRVRQIGGGASCPQGHPPDISSSSGDGRSRPSSIIDASTCSSRFQWLRHSSIHSGSAAPTSELIQVSTASTILPNARSWLDNGRLRRRYRRQQVRRSFPCARLPPTSARLRECLQSRELFPDHQGVNLLGPFVGDHGLEVRHVAHDRVLERDAVGAKDPA